MINPWALKLATARLTGFALPIVLAGTQSVFSLAILSWSTLAEAFGSMLILPAMGRDVTSQLALPRLSGCCLRAVGAQAHLMSISSDVALKWSG